VVEHSPHHPKVEGMSTATGADTENDKMANFFTLSVDTGILVVKH